MVGFFFLGGGCFGTAASPSPCLERGAVSSAIPRVLLPPWVGEAGGGRKGWGGGGDKGGGCTAVSSPHARVYS